MAASAPEYKPNFAGGSSYIRPQFSHPAITPTPPISQQALK